MDISWWQLPGPAQFVRSIVQDLRDGKNVVVSMPKHAPCGLRESIALLIRDNDRTRWKTLAAVDGQLGSVVQLSEYLFKKFVALLAPNETATPSLFAQRLIDTVIWVETPINESCDAWGKFLTQYQHACQAIDISERSLFCVENTGRSLSSITDDVALTTRRWYGAVGRLDMTLYFHHALAARFRNRMHSSVALAVIAELAGSDRVLGEYLSTCDLGTILNPFVSLQAFASQRSWSSSQVRIPNWHEGHEDLIDGEPTLHSAAVAVLGDRSEINRRVWRGQVAILYPFIEQQRAKILPQVRSHLRLPVETRFGRIDDAEDLEVGQLLHVLRDARIPPRIRRLLQILTSMRHALAHLEPVPHSTLIDPELLRIDTLK